MRRLSIYFFLKENLFNPKMSKFIGFKKISVDNLIDDE